MTTRDERKTGRASGQQAGRHPKRENLIPNIGEHVHEDGEVCKHFHAETRCDAYACGNWALDNCDGLCAAHFGKTVVTEEPDGTPVSPARIEPTRVPRKHKEARDVR